MTLSDQPITVETTTPIPLVTAQQWISNWRKLPANAKEKCVDEVLAMRLPGSDIHHLVDSSKTPQAVAVRTYFAAEELPDHTFKAHLLLVAVIEQNGREVDDIERGIFDFTAPCPHTCDETSPLYTLTPPNLSN